MYFNHLPSAFGQWSFGTVRETLRDLVQGLLTYSTLISSLTGVVEVQRVPNFHQQVKSLSSYQWTLQNDHLNISVPASFPSYAHLDLGFQLTGELEYGLNDFDLRWIWMQNWTYSTVIPDLDKYASQTILLFNGLDTFTTIHFCGQYVASTDNQFRQYYFNISSLLSFCTGDPTLSLNFGSAPNIAAAIANQPGQETWPPGVNVVNEIPNRWFVRKQQNDFGWDWGPAYAPAGPWQPAYVLQMEPEQVHPRNVLVDVYKLGQRNNLIPDQSQPWVVNASIDIIGTLPADATMSYEFKDATNHTVRSGQLSNMTLVNNAISGSTIMPRDAVELWWPVNMGPQTLYYMTISVHGPDGSALTTVTRRIGFRTIILNELPVSDAERALGIAPGNHWHFEINGHPFFAKGSNFIPPDIFWPRVTPDRMRTLLNAVVVGNQNMLRVWSSGAYSPDFMFDIADELGILLWSEFEFSDGLYPVTPEFLSNVREEAVYQVRRVNHHPSLAYWAGGNELENLILPTVNESDPVAYPRYVQEYEKLFLTTLFPAVFENSRGISYAPSSTSKGFITLNFTDAPYMQERYEGMTEPGSIYGETDYYNYNSSLAFDYSSYPVGRFSNEFGYHSMPSLQTWRDYVPENELFFNSTTILLRNRHYSPGSLNTTNFYNTSQGMAEMTTAAERWYPVPNKSNSIANFSAWCWTTQVFQADFYGAQIQFYRRGSGLPQRTLGSLYWQLEDQWAAPTWAGIERSGRWKILHYKAKDLYQNVIVSPFYNVSTKILEVCVTSDLWSSVTGTVDGSWHAWDGSPITSMPSISNVSVTVGALNSTCVATISLVEMTIDLENAILKLSVTANGKLPNSDKVRTFTHINWFHAAPLSSAKLVDPGLTLSFDQSTGCFTVIATSGVSAWTWLDYPAGAVVAFSENGFWLAKGESRCVSYTIISDDTGGRWRDGVTIQSLWNNTVT